MIDIAVFIKLSPILNSSSNFKIGKTGDDKDGIASRYKGKYLFSEILYQNSDLEQVTQMELDIIKYCKEKYPSRCNNIDDSSKHHIEYGEDGFGRV